MRFRNLLPLAFVALLPAVPATGGAVKKPATRSAPAPTAAKRKPKPKKPAVKAPEAKKPNARKPEPEKPAAKKPKKDDSVEFFARGVIPRLKIEISEPELQKLRQKEREYVRCTIVEEGGKTYEHVGIKLKGAAGSFRGIDDRPALTLNFDKFKKGQDFHDLDKIHLNNSVQDPTYLNELLCSELFLAAKVPAARTTHARVWLNGRDLGFYVLKEGFNKQFLKRHFAHADGNLYEGGFVQDLDGNVELENGSGPTDRSDVKAVIDACREGDPAKRWARVEQVVDIDHFISFAAMEMMTCHWDGYCQNRNNYRFYIEPKSGKIHFFPHGMDQMFGDPNFPILNVPGAMVANAVLSNPEWRWRYRDRLSELIKLMAPPDRLLKRIDEHAQRMRPVIAQINEGQAKEFDNRVRELKERLQQRAKSLLQQNAVVEPRPLRFDAASGAAALPEWASRLETPDARLELLDAKGGNPKSYSITAGPSNRCVASWRARVLLPAGKYRLEAKAKAINVKALQESSGTGAGLRISGSGRTNKLEGSTGWTSLAHEFQVSQPTQEVELVAELRATGGQVLFDAKSLRLVRVRQ